MRAGLSSVANCHTDAAPSTTGLVASTRRRQSDGPVPALPWISATLTTPSPAPSAPRQPPAAAYDALRGKQRPMSDLTDAVIEQHLKALKLPAMRREYRQLAPHRRSRLLDPLTLQRPALQSGQIPTGARTAPLMPVPPTAMTAEALSRNLSPDGSIPRHSCALPEILGYAGDIMWDLTPKAPFLFCSLVHVPPVADHQHHYYGPVDPEYDPVIAYP